MPQIHIIAPTKQQQPDRLRVCAYARVSSDSTDQLNSYASQIRYYTSYITAHENWDFVDIYADEGITGTRADKRDDFQRMLRDCRAHRIDLILVKSLSRFARNTEDCIAAVRELRQLGVTVIFEKEHLNTGTMANEMLLSMMSAFAQEESVSISKNMHKGAVMRMQNGTYISKAAYGYRITKNGQMEIIPEEAEIVRFIYKCFLSGDGVAQIRNKLLSMPLTLEQKKQFSESGITYILTNERYIGDELLQKTMGTGQVPFHRLNNKGQLPQYYIENTHASIISREQFVAAQLLFERRRQKFGKPLPSCKYRLTDLLRCSFCGKSLRRRVRSAGIEWDCSTHLKSSCDCPLKSIPNDTILFLLNRFCYKLIYSQASILDSYILRLEQIRNKALLFNVQMHTLNLQLTELLEQNHTLNRLHTKGCIDSAFFISQSEEIEARITVLRSTLNTIRSSASYSVLTKNTVSLMSILSEYKRDHNPEAVLPFISKIVFSSHLCQFHLVNGLVFEEEYERRYAHG